MNILHISSASAYTFGLTYQDNMLSEINAQDGQSVLVISDCKGFIDGDLVDTKPENIVFNNIHLIRLRYSKIFNNLLSSKLRKMNELYGIIEDFKPDVILHHGLASLTLLDAARYKASHKDIKLYADTHADFNNSAKNLLSKNVLHKMIYKNIINNVLPCLDKIFFVGYEAKIFAQSLYNIPEDKLEYLPLGGIIIPADEYLKKRSLIRSESHLHDSDILCIHSGKMDEKKRTLELLKAFTVTTGDNLKLFIIGSLSENIKAEALSLIASDNRIKYLGWKTGEELLDLLCAGDLYVQPGGQSATMQNALCSGCAAALYPHESHKYLLGDSVFYINTIEDMVQLFKRVSLDRNVLEAKRNQSFKIAKEKLDYKKLAARLYE